MLHVECGEPMQAIKHFFDNIYFIILEDKYVKSRVQIGCYISRQYYTMIRKMYMDSMLDAYKEECKGRIREKYR